MEYEHRSSTISEYKRLRNSVGWWATDDKATEVTLFSIVTIKNGNSVVFGRIIGDGGLYYYIQDLIVHPGFQKMGLRALTRHSTGRGTACLFYSNSEHHARYTGSWLLINYKSFTNYANGV
jgi:hypothetical protein